MTLYSLNPANGILLRSYDTLTAEAVTSKIANAQLAFEQYRESTLDHRVMWMKKLAGILEQEMEELATLLTTETGKTIRASREEVLQCAACCRYFAESAAALLGDESVEIDANRCTTSWRPMGVLFAVVPESNAFWQVFRMAVPALLGGNTLVLKHSDNVPQCALEMELLLRRAGFARGVFQTLLMDSADIEIVLNDEHIAGVAIAGMRQAGREIAAHTAWMGKKAVTEQQGASSFIVMPSANLFAAIQAGVTARCLDNGQSAESTSHFIVHESVYDEFAFLFVSAMEDVKVGNPFKDETELGPMATLESLIRLKAQIADAVAGGGRVVTGGEPMLGDGNYFEPTVIMEVPANARFCRDEMHGPVAVLFKVSSVNEAVRLANRASGSGVCAWTQDEPEKQQLAQGLTCGNVFLNSPMVMDARMASGSLTGGGCGRTMVASSLRNFMIAKTTVTAGLILESEFSFDLSLADFEKEAQLAETAEERKQSTGYEAFAPEELELADDLFVMSKAAGGEPGSVLTGLKTMPEAVDVPTGVALLDEPEVEEIQNLREVALPVVTAKKTVVPRKAHAKKKSTTPKKKAAHKTAFLPEPVVIAPTVVVEKQETAVGLDVASPPAVPTFKEMFERALMVRV